MQAADTVTAQYCTQKRDGAIAVLQGRVCTDIPPCKTLHTHCMGTSRRISQRELPAAACRCGLEVAPHDAEQRGIPRGIRPAAPPPSTLIDRRF